jgi:hypothetical protein
LANPSKAEGVTSKDLSATMKLTRRRAEQIWKHYLNTGQEPLMGSRMSPSIKPFNAEEAEIVREANQRYRFGARMLERIIRKVYKVRISHNRIHIHLPASDLANKEPNKQMGRKWVQYEREHSMSAGHIDWHEVERTGIKVYVIEDDASRKILAFAPNSGLVVRDNLHESYYFFSIVDLYLMPKMRVNRVIKKQVETMKGKWLIDLRNGTSCDKLPEVFAVIESYLANRKTIFLHTLECYGNYSGEGVGQGGITRKPGHWEIDVKGTR